MSYGQVWYEDRHGRPYSLVAGMRVYQSTGRDYLHSRSDQITAKNTLYNERYSRPSLHRHSLSTASAAHQGYAASMPRVRFADDIDEGRDRSWSPKTEDSYTPKRETRKHSTKPNIVPWPSSYQDTESFEYPSTYHKKSHHKKSTKAKEYITGIDAEPGHRVKKYDDDLYYRDGYALEPRRRSSSRESYGSRSSSRESYVGDDYMARRPVSHIGHSRYFY